MVNEYIGDDWDYVIQTYFIFFIAWFGGSFLRLPHPVCAPAAMIGASNFFELAVAVAIALFGLQSPAAMVTVGCSSRTATSAACAESNVGFHW